MLKRPGIENLIQKNTLSSFTILPAHYLYIIHINKIFFVELFLHLQLHEY